MAPQTLQQNDELEIDAMIAELDKEDHSGRKGSVRKNILKNKSNQPDLNETTRRKVVIDEEDEDDDGESVDLDAQIDSPGKP